MRWPAVFAAALACLLAACDSLPFLGAKEAPPLPGKRIAILVGERDLSADEDASREQIVLPAPTRNENWPQAGGYPNHAMHHILVAENIQRAWSRSIGEGSSKDERVIAQPVVSDGRIFTMDAETVVRAGKEKTGEEIWKVNLTPKGEDSGEVGGGLAVDNGTLFVTTGYGEVVALNVEDGKVAWRRDLTAPIRSAPTVISGRAFVLTLTNKLYALDSRTGEVLWSHSGIEEPTNLLGGASPAADAGVVIVPYSSGELIALRMENGQELWNDSLAGQRRTRGTTSLSAIRGRPILDRGVVYATGFGGLTVAINVRTGRRIWEREIASMESPWIAGDTLYVLTVNEELAAINRTDGHIHWVTQLPQWKSPKDKEDRIIWTGPLLVSDRLIVAGSQGEAWSISPYTGQVLGKVDLPDGVTVAPIAAGDTVYFLSDDADLVAYR